MELVYGHPIETSASQIDAPRGLWTLQEKPTKYRGERADAHGPPVRVPPLRPAGPAALRGLRDRGLQLRRARRRGALFLRGPMRCVVRSLSALRWKRKQKVEKEECKFEMLCGAVYFQ